MINRTLKREQYREGERKKKENQNDLYIYIYIIAFQVLFHFFQDFLNLFDDD